MTTALPSFALHRPRTVDEALALLDEDRVAYGGGTELLLAMRVGLLRPDALVDIKRIPELAGIERRGGALRIGASVTHHEVAHSDVVAGHSPALARVAAHVGNARVRAQGTIGGNLCFAEPKSDVAPLLIALGATVELRSAADGVRELPMADFIEGPYWTTRADDELLTAVTVPAPRRAVYVKYQTMERPTVGVAVAATDGGYRIVVGAAVEVPIAIDAPTLDVDVDAIAAGLEPVPDLTGSEDYKRHVAAVHIRRAIAHFEEQLT